MKVSINKIINPTLVALGAISLWTCSTNAVAQQANTKSYSNIQNQYSTVMTKNAEYFGCDRLDAYVEIVDYMRDFVGAEEWSKNYLPIKLASAHAKVMMNAHGPMSLQTRGAILRLIEAVNTAGDSLDKLLSINAFYNTAVDLLTMQEIIKQMMN